MASETAINECPVPVIFTTEGQEVKTGSKTQNLSDDNPINPHCSKCGLSTQHYLYLYYNDTEIIRELYDLDIQWMEKAAMIHPGATTSLP